MIAKVNGDWVNQLMAGLEELPGLPSTSVLELSSMWTGDDADTIQITSRGSSFLYSKSIPPIIDVGRN